MIGSYRYQQPNDHRLWYSDLSWHAASNVSQGAAAIGVGFNPKILRSNNWHFLQVWQVYSASLNQRCMGSTYGLKHLCMQLNDRWRFGGLFMGIMRVRNFSGGSPGLLTLPSYIGDDTLRHLTQCLYRCGNQYRSHIYCDIILIQRPCHRRSTWSNTSRQEQEPTHQISGAEIKAPLKGN